MRHAESCGYEHDETKPCGVPAPPDDVTLRGSACPCHNLYDCAEQPCPCSRDCGLTFCAYGED